MKKLLSNGKVVVSFVSVFAILAVSLLSVFAGTGFIASADETDTDEQAVSYPIGGTYDASVVLSSDSNAGNADEKTVTSKFSGYDNEDYKPSTFWITTEGNGTAANPFIIHTADEFAAMVNGLIYDEDVAATNNRFKKDRYTIKDGVLDTTGLCFKVADDVKAFDLSATSNATAPFSGDMTAEQVEAALKNADIKIAWQGTEKFAGRFDGNGVEIYGLCSKNSDNNGLFPNVAGNVELRNFTLKNSYIYGDVSGAVIGRIYNDMPVIFRNCEVADCVVVSTHADNAGNPKDGAENYGGVLYGYGAGSVITVDNCFVHGNVAKHATIDITYGMLGGNTATGHTLSNSVVLDTMPMFNIPASVNSAFVSGKVTIKYLYTNMVDAEVTNKNVKYAIKKVKGNTNAIHVGDSTGKYNAGCIYGINADDIKGSSADATLEKLNKDYWKVNESGYPSLNVYYVEEYSYGEPWSGKIAALFSGGNGKATTPYLINTPEELALMLTSNTKGIYFKLNRDILINDTWFADWTTDAKQWFTSNDIPAFEGVFDGNGYTVTGLYYGGSQKGESAGLIPVVAAGAEVRNVKVADSELNGKSGKVLGAVVGAVADKCKTTVKINSCVAYDTVVFKGAATSGGIVGNVGYSLIYMNDCLSESAGLFGDITGVAKVKRCVSVNDSPFGKTDNVTAENVYTDKKGNDIEGVTVLTVDKMKGDNASTNMSGLNIPQSWKVVADDFPMPTGVTVVTASQKGDVWSGAIASDYSEISGDGSKANPWLIETAEQLALIVTKPQVGADEASRKYYKFAADIYLNDVNSPLWADKVGCNEWFTHQEVESERAWQYTTIDGDGYVVYGLYKDRSTSDTLAESRIALFPQISTGTIVENIGVSEAYVLGKTSLKNESCGAIVGMVRSWNTENGLNYVMDGKDADANSTTRALADFQAKEPKIRNCLVDHTTYIKGDNSGGIVGVAGGPVLIENCIFTGSVDYDIGATKDGVLFGTMIGNEYAHGSSIKNCVSLPQSCNKLFDGSSGAIWRTTADIHVVEVSNVYYFSAKKQIGATTDKAIRVNRPEQRIGEAAKAIMKNLDWEETPNDGGTWRVIDGGTPVLAVFARHRNDEQLKTLSDFSFSTPTVTVSFMTNDNDVKVDSISGKMYSKLSLPTPEREGYNFTGWYVFDDLSIEYPADYFPPRDITLYAGWEATGVVQGFEKYTDTNWDYDKTQWTLNKPGAKGGYKNAYVRTGGRSMHLLDTNTEPVDVLINYEDMLEPGRNYRISFWVATDKVNNPDTLLSLVHNSKPVYLDTGVACENMVVASGLKVGEWTKYTYTFTAQTKWASIRASGNNSSLYFDDIIIAPIDGTVSNNSMVNLDTNNSNNSNNATVNDSQLSPNTGDTVTVAVLVSAIIACAVVAVVSRKNSIEVID